MPSGLAKSWRRCTLGACPVYIKAVVAPHLSVVQHRYDTSHVAPRYQSVAHHAVHADTMTSTDMRHSPIYIYIYMYIHTYIHTHCYYHYYHYSYKLFFFFLLLSLYSFIYAFPRSSSSASARGAVRSRHDGARDGWQLVSMCVYIYIYRCV